MGYMVWASHVQKYADWCEILALLKIKKAGSEKLSSQSAYNMLTHSLYEKLYIEKWSALRDRTHKRADADALARKTLAKAPEIIRREWKSTVYPALQNEGKEMTIETYTDFFLDRFETDQFYRVCENVAYTTRKRGGGRINFIAECSEWDLLKDARLGVGARPDFIISMGNKIMVADVKKRITRGAELQNVVGYLVVLRNMDGLARKLGLDPKKADVVKQTLFENYSTGKEEGYFVEDLDWAEIMDIASKLRKNEVQEKRKICTSIKQANCGLCGVCIKQYGSIEELLKSG